MTRCTVMLLGLLCCPPISAAGEVNLPIRLDAAYLREAFVSQVFTEPGPSARVWDDGTGCNVMVVSDPRVSAGDERVNLVTTGEARVGRRVGGRCVLVLDWSGSIEMVQTAELEPDGQAVRFRVVDSRVYDEAVQHGFRVGTLWDWIKNHVHPRLAAVRIDLRPALDELKAVLHLVLPEEHAVVPTTLDTISLESARVIDGGVVVKLSMRVPDRSYEPRTPAPALTAAEQARFEAAWQGWDSFITFVVKHAAASTATPELRRELLDVLIDARYELLEVLTADATDYGADPVRDLFVDTWSRLAPVLRQLSTELPGERALNLFSFITAADALQTLDALGPELNLDISVAGLRRLARILIPDSEADPLTYDQRVDPTLRQLFDFGPPPTLRDNPARSPRGRRRGLLLPEARAATPVNEALITRLNGWIPEPTEIDAYLLMVYRLLDATEREVASGSRLDSELHPMYRILVLATAWQETCWRQFQQVDGKILPVRSPAGAVGLMQVVPTVWRGFYEPGGLERDIAYNAVAGSEILMHYLLDYAIERGEHRHPGGRENLAWATYAAYHGGPGNLRRYRSAEAPPALRRIDRAFREKFRMIRNGDELAVRACYTE